MQSSKPGPIEGEPAGKVPASFETEPSRYRHWRLLIDGAIARLEMAVRDEEPLVPGYVLKLNSYDLGVDLELADAVQRLRFSHPEVKTVVVTSGRDRVFCAGANIHMLAASTHGFKVNFCKFTNETRLSIEDASRHSGQRYLAAVNGSCAGGGYELAMACDEIILIDDGSSTVSLPEVPLLGVLPGTGGLTRLVDKRRVRRDRADVFATLAEGMRGKRAVEWQLVDKVVPRSRFAQVVAERAQALVKEADAAQPERTGPGIPWPSIEPAIEGETLRYRHVELSLSRRQRIATLTLSGPGSADEVPTTPAALHAAAAQNSLWALRAFRELDDALLRLRFHEPSIGLVLLKTRGQVEDLLRADEALAAMQSDWLASEIRLFIARVLRRLDQTSRSFFAIGDQKSCFAGSLLEVLLAADRSYFLDQPKEPVRLGVSALNDGALPHTTGQSRLAMRFLDQPEAVRELLAKKGVGGGIIDATEADELGLVTFLLDDLDFEDTLRMAIEERVSLSPDALTGMEQNLRCPGSEGCDSKIFGRLSAWQNWIFIRDNATGEKGALSSYGKPERPVFDWTRT